MDPHVGHRYVVKINRTVENWYPDSRPSGDEGSSRATAYSFTGEDIYDLICDIRSLVAVEDKIQELMEQDWGECGKHDGRGVNWFYCVQSIDYKGEVRL